MYDDILFPTDGSDATRQALVHAIELSEQFGATLHVLTVITGDPFRTSDGQEAAAEAAERTVDAAAERAQRSDLSTSTAVRSGNPHEEILSYVDEEGIDMIVMGTHGRTGVGRALLGSVTERVLRRADVPVVTVSSSDEITITDPEDASEIAVDELRDRGHRDVEVVEEPYRTSGTWIVPVTGEDLRAHVHIDAGSGTARVARLDDRG